MVKYLLTTLIMILLTGFSATRVQALVDFPGFPDPGTSCGNPTKTNANKCCFFKPLEPPNPPQSGIGVIDTMVSTLDDWIGEKIFGPVLNPANDMIQKNIIPCLEGVPSTPGDLGNASCTCVIPTKAPLENLKPLCANIDQSRNNIEYVKCLNCLSGGGGRSGGEVGIWTAAGCIKTNPRSFIEQVVAGWGIGLAGGLALLCIIYAAFTMQSSQGNPERLKKAQEMITSCIMGLMLIIFSVFILRLIGVSILKIPGFS